MPKRSDVGVRYAIEVWGLLYGEMAWKETSWIDFSTPEEAAQIIASNFAGDDRTRLVEYNTTSRVVT